MTPMSETDARPIRALVVDDDREVRRTMADYLALHGVLAEPLDGGPALRRRLPEPPPADVVLLDLTMPGEDGLSLMRWLRTVSTVGVIMVTARGDLVDRVVGLELGADDYLAKPVELRELLARVRALARRAREAAAAPSGPRPGEPPGERLRVGRLWLDVEGRTLREPDGRAIPLTSGEFDLLEAMARRPGRPLSREQLLDLAHPNPEEPFDRAIDSRIARLRRKIERDPAHPEIIRTLRGLGYVLAPPEPG
jgi:two-component system phosphate regulon response regulator OmpR